MFVSKCIETLLNVFNVSMFSIFSMFQCQSLMFWSKTELKFIILFRFIRFAKIEQRFKNLKIETLNIDIALTFNVHYFDIENIESKSMLKFLSTLTSH